MNKAGVIGLIVFLVMVVGLGGCTNVNPPAVLPVASLSETLERHIAVPMTGVHAEYFDFRQGDMVVGELVIDGKYDVDLSVGYMVEEGGIMIAGVVGSDVLSLEDIQGYEMFTFVVPVSANYVFFFRGYYADKPDGKPFAQLSEAVTLRITVNPK